MASEAAVLPHEGAACDLCGGSELRLLYALEPPIYCCAGCGLVLSADALAGVEPRHVYDESFWSDPYWRKQSGDWRRSPDARLYRAILDQANALGVSRGTLLDVGCGPGTFLAAARDAGFTVRGVDISPLAVEACGRNIADASVELRDIVANPFPTGSFDVVSMLDILEHVASPRTLLARAHDMLRPGGLLLLRTINEDTVFNLLGRVLYRLRRPAASQRMHERYHLVYFNRAQLERYLVAGGFRIRWHCAGEISFGRVAASPLTRWAVIAPIYCLQWLLKMQYEQVIVAERSASNHRVS